MTRPYKGKNLASQRPLKNLPKKTKKPRRKALRGELISKVVKVKAANRKGSYVKSHQRRGTTVAAHTAKRMVKHAGSAAIRRSE